MAQLVEQLIRNQQVAGSSPATSSKAPKPYGFGAFQRVEKPFSARWQTAKKVRKTSNSRPSAYIDTVYPQGARRIRNAPSSRTAAQARELRSKSKYYK